MKVKNVIGYSLLATVVLALAVGSYYTGKLPAKVALLSELPTLYLIFSFAGAASLLIFYFWMFLDAITNEKLEHRGLWIIDFLVFNCVASIVYFFIHGRIRAESAPLNQDGDGVT